MPREGKEEAIQKAAEKRAVELLEKDDSLDSLCRTLVAARRLYSFAKGTLQVRLAGEQHTDALEKWVLDRVQSQADSDDRTEQNDYFDLLYIAAPWLATEIRLMAMRRAQELKGNDKKAKAKAG
jgi:hypothetical protein